MTEKIFVTAVIAIADQPNEMGIIMPMEVLEDFVREDPEKYWIVGNKLMVRVEMSNGYSCSKNLA